MAHIDLNPMSLYELKDLQRDVARAITNFEDRKRKEALAALEEKAREMGFSIAELTGVKISKIRAPATAKYADPANPSNTWSGRGRQPRWFSEAVAAGKKPEELSL